MEAKKRAAEAAPQAQYKDSKKLSILQAGGNIFDEAIFQAVRNSAEQGIHLPIDGFSAQVQDHIENVTLTYQTNRDAVVLSCLVVGGVAAGKNIIIHDGRFYNNCSLFGCFVAPSGSNKSETVKAPTMPLKMRNRDKYDAYKAELDAWKAIKKNTDPRPIWRNQCIISDATPEALTQCLYANDGGLVQYGDELLTIFANIERYNKNAGATFYLSAFDASDITINRKCDDTLLISRPFLSVLGTTQPQTLKSIFSESSMSAGLPQRFLFVYQQETTMTPYSERSLDRGSVERWGNLIGRIFDSPQRTLEIRDGAKMIYIDLFNRLQEKKFSANTYMCSVYSKLQIIVERLAGVVHLLNENPTDLITAEDMRFACSLMPYFERTQTLVYNTLVDDTSTSLSKAEIVRQLFANFDCVSQNAVAMAIGIDRGNLSKMLKK